MYQKEEPTALTYRYLFVFSPSFLSGPGFEIILPGSITLIITNRSVHKSSGCVWLVVQGRRGGPPLDRAHHQQRGRAAQAHPSGPQIYRGEQRRGRLGGPQIHQVARK